MSQITYTSNGVPVNEGLVTRWVNHRTFTWETRGFSLCGAILFWHYFFLFFTIRNFFCILALEHSHNNSSTWNSGQDELTFSITKTKVNQLFKHPELLTPSLMSSLTSHFLDWKKKRMPAKYIWPSKLVLCKCSLCWREGDKDPHSEASAYTHICTHRSTHTKK